MSMQITASEEKKRNPERLRFFYALARERRLSKQDWFFTLR